MNEISDYLLMVGFKIGDKVTIVTEGGASITGKIIFEDSKYQRLVIETDNKEKVVITKKYIILMRRVKDESS